MKEIIKYLFRRFDAPLSRFAARLREGLTNISILFKTFASSGLGTGWLQRREEGSREEAVGAVRARR